MWKHLLQLYTPQTVLTGELVTTSVCSERHRGQTVAAAELLSLISGDPLTWAPVSYATRPCAADCRVSDRNCPCCPAAPVSLRRGRSCGSCPPVARRDRAAAR